MKDNRAAYETFVNRGNEHQPHFEEQEDTEEEAEMPEDEQRAWLAARLREAIRRRRDFHPPMEWRGQYAVGDDYQDGLFAC